MCTFRQRLNFETCRMTTVSSKIIVKDKRNLYFQKNYLKELEFFLYNLKPFNFIPQMQGSLSTLDN